MKNFLARSACALVFAFAAQAASASVLLRYQEIGGNVVGTLSGSLDLTGAAVNTLNGDKVEALAFWAYHGLADLGTIPKIMSAYDVTGPDAFGSGGLEYPTSGSGDFFGVYGAFSAVMLSENYVSLAPLSATETFAGKTFASMGITQGTYTYKLPNDSITVQFGASPVPMPATFPLLAAGLGFFGFSRLRKRRSGRTQSSSVA